MSVQCQYTLCQYNSQYLQNIDINYKLEMNLQF